MSPPPVPTGLQRLLRLASEEGRFRAALLARRSGIAAPAAVALSASERAILDSIPEAQLAAMIDGLPPAPTDRRTFLRDAALAALGVLAGAPLAACEEKAAPDSKADGGDVSPETPLERPATPPTAGGARPDVPEGRPPAAPGGAPERPRKRITSFGHESGSAE